MPAKTSDRLKIIAGTNQPCRMSKDIPLSALSDAPVRPAWLKHSEAIREWNRLTEFMMRHQLLNSGNIHMLAHLCGLHGKLAEMWSSGTPPIAALLAAYRGLSISLGLLSLAAPMTDARPVNKFSNNAARKTLA